MTKANEDTKKTKILVNVYEPLIAILKNKMDAACLKRDAYLDKALRCEAELLRKEIKKPNSDRTRTYIADNLKELNLKPLNLLLSQETVELINEVCNEKNIHRDVFINRFFLLLVASNATLMVLFSEIIARYYSTYFEEDLSINKDIMEIIVNMDDETFGNLFEKQDRYINFFWDRDNVLDTIEEFVTYTPFARLRAIIELMSDNHDDNLYSFVFNKHALNKLPEEYECFKPKTTLGFNTFMSDEQVSKQESLDNESNLRTRNDKLLAAIQLGKQSKNVDYRKKKEIKSVGEE